jgi:hypothetical protein
MDRLCSGLQGGIEAAIHAMQDIWDFRYMEEEWGFLLIDAKNAFNEMDRTVMMWNVRNEWLSGARFVSNNYKHWAALEIRTNDDKGETLHNNQGMTPGDPMASSDYAVWLFPLIRKIKKEFTD